MMRTVKNKTVITAILLMSFFTLNGQDYQQTRQLMVSGGKAEGEQYSLNGSAGQIIVERSSGGQFEVQAGFWKKNLDLIFENEFE